MNHLTDEQLSALLDDVLSAGERAACDAHLGGCEACRTRLAEASALDASLGKALERDPGEGYFADFADRVARRIATGARPLDAAPQAATPRSIWAWLTSPRGLALAGSTAALLVTAGIAWMRFHGEQDVSRTLREASPRPQSTVTHRLAAPDENDEAQPQAAPPAAAAPSPVAEGARSDAVAPVPGAARAQKLRTLPNGEQVPETQAQGGAPARQEATNNALAAPATGSAIAQMKRKAVAPTVEAGAPAPAATGVSSKDAKEEAAKEKGAKEQVQATRARDADAPPAPAQNFAAPPAPAAAPHAKSSLDQDTARGQSFNEWGASKSLYKNGRADDAKVGAKSLPSLAATCGRVRDSRGHVVAGAQVTAMQNGVRTARTDADGQFCIDGLKAGDTLTVRHVGFDPYTVVMTPMTSLAITLEPVGTLGPNATMLTGKAPTSSPTLSGAVRGYAPPADSAPRPDIYADQSYGVRQLVRDAREAASVAQREHTAPSFENAAKQWAAVLRQVKGAPADDARFQYVSTVRTAYQLEPTRDREGRLRSAITAFLALAPASLPERATVERWQAELNGSPGR